MWHDKGKGSTLPREATELAGIAASPGRATGLALWLKAADASGESHTIPRPGSILLTDFVTPSHILFLLEVRGVATMTGGATSHGASLSRDLGIPCVCGLGSSLERIVDGSEVTIDGTHGTITLT